MHTIQTVIKEDTALPCANKLHIPLLFKARHSDRLNAKDFIFLGGMGAAS